MMRFPKSMWLLALGACDPAAPAAVEAPAPIAAAPVAPPVTAPPVLPAPVEPPAEPVAAETPLPGVGPGGAEGRTARRQAVLDLLGDGRSASVLALAATEPGSKLDPELAEKLTPPPVILKRSISDRPTVRQGKHKVKGPLEPDIVRRIVRAHINELQYCYNRGLVSDRWLAGRVVVDFQILATGVVGASTLTSTTLSDRIVGECTVEATRRWLFPKPERGVVVDVTYPFEFGPG